MEEIMFNKNLILQPNTFIHCDSEEKANKLLAWGYSIGKRWSTGDSFLDENYYYYDKDKTCYNIYSGEFSSLQNIISFGGFILGYEDVLINATSYPDYTNISIDPGAKRFTFTIHFKYRYDNSNLLRTGEMKVDADNSLEAEEKVKRSYPNVKIDHKLTYQEAN
jgi:hypothetical protein